MIGVFVGCLTGAGLVWCSIGIYHMARQEWEQGAVYGVAGVAAFLVAVLLGGW